MKSLHTTVLLSTRVSRKLREAFHEKAKQYGVPAEVHREILQGFVDGRLTLERKPKPIDKLYGENDES